MPDPRQLALLLVTILVPVYLIVKHRDRQLLAWICFTVCIDIFDPKVLINLPAARFTGLLLLPQAVHFLPSFFRTRPGKALILQYSYLVFLGVVFGFIFPWSSGVGLIRTFNQIAQGRAVIYLVRAAADVSLVFFVAKQIIILKSPEVVLRYLLFGTSVAALAGIAEWLTRIDFYGLITGLRSLQLEYRVRGFNYEPRGFGLIATYGIILSILLFAHQRSWKLIFMVSLNMFAFILAGSTAALVAVGLGAITLFLFDRRVRRISPVFAIIGVLVFGLLLILNTGLLNTYLGNAQMRLTTDRIQVKPTNIIEELAFRMDIFDGPALLFLASNPIYFMIGTGPGLVPLPATAYVPQSSYYLWSSDTGINSPPSMGVMLELSNAGLIGLILCFTIYSASFRALNFLSKVNKPIGVMWLLGRNAFVCAVILYLVQASPLSAIFPIFIGYGVAAYYLAQKHSYSSGISTQPNNPLTTIIQVLLLSERIDGN